METIRDEIELTEQQQWFINKYVYGYKTEANIVGISENLLKFQTKVKELPLPLSQLPASNIKSVLEKGQAFFDQYFRLHKIRSISEEELDALQYFEPESSEEMLDKLNSYPSIHPYNLPLLLKDVDFIYGLTLAFYAIVEDLNLNYIKKTPILFRSISLSGYITPISTATYVHEVTHTQLDSQKGSVTSFINSEVLSIFLEFLSLENTPYLDFILNYRLKLLDDSISSLRENDVSDYFSLEVAESSSKYIASTIKAYQLYSIYSKGNLALKKEILNYIQNIFNNEICLEEVLNKYEITTHNGVKLVLEK